jgi:hypothetical protein
MKYRAMKTEEVEDIYLFRYWNRHYVEVSGQRHASAALSFWEEPR